MTNKWAEIINERGSVGVLWQTEDDWGFAESATSENKELVTQIRQRQEILSESPLSIEVKYGVLFDYINSRQNCLSISSEGDSEEMHALIAAATPKRYSSAELQSLLQPSGEYSITYDDDKNVIGLVWDDNGEIFVRESGEWLAPDEEDERIYGGSVRYVNEDAVELFDKLVQDKSAPKLESFKEVSLG